MNCSLASCVSGEFIFLGFPCWFCASSHLSCLSGSQLMRSRSLSHCNFDESLPDLKGWPIESKFYKGKSFMPPLIAKTLSSVNGWSEPRLTLPFHKHLPWSHLVQWQSSCWCHCCRRRCKPLLSSFVSSLATHQEAQWSYTLVAMFSFKGQTISPSPDYSFRWNLIYLPCCTSLKVLDGIIQAVSQPFVLG